MTTPAPRGASRPPGPPGRGSPLGTPCPRYGGNPHITGAWGPQWGPPSGGSGGPGGPPGSGGGHNIPGPQADKHGPPDPRYDRQARFFFLFKPDTDSSEWRDVYEQPLMMIGMDLGSDGLAGYNYIDFKERLNVDCCPDLSDGGNRDVINALHSTDLFQLWLLWVISMNLPYGPDRNDQRGMELREALAAAITDNSPAKSPLFQAQSAGMLE